MSNKNEVEGMTDLQYKGMLLDQLCIWKELQDLASREDMSEIKIRIQQQIDCINQKLRV